MKAGTNIKQYPFSFYLTISFIEGGAVLACELLSARMVAPFYGTTLFVWSAIIGVTLAALAIGYFLGGYLVDRNARNDLLFTVLSIGSVFIALMPISAEFALEFTSGLGIRTGALVSAMIFLLPPLACLGTTSPIIIRLANRDLQHTGRTAGTVYAVSTISGILATFLIGFYAIPHWGITTPVYWTAIVLALFPLIFFIKVKKYIPALVLVVALAIITLLLNKQNEPSTSSGWKILYNSEGLLGQVIVADRNGEVKDSSNRILFVNKQPQTNVWIENGYSIWPYVHAIAVVSSIKPPGSDALILGLGGGSIADEFFRLGFNVDGCELDERITQAAHKFFNLDDRCRVFIDDARHHIRTTRKKYDIIVLDTFTGEQVPSHLLTLENCTELKGTLKSDGILLINFTGFLTGKTGLASRSIYRTLKEAGFVIKLIATPGAEDLRNLIFVASPIPQDFSQIKQERQNKCCTDIMKVPIPPPFIDERSIDLRNTIIFTDDKPVMEVVHLVASETWRRNTVRSFEIEFNGLPLF